MAVYFGLECPLMASSNSSLELEKGAYQLKIARSIDTVRYEWDQVVGDQQFFISSRFAAALETTPPAGVEFVYLIFYNGPTPIGVAYCQTFTFDAFESLKARISSSAPKWYDPIRSALAKNIRFKTLVCGNLLFSGPHAYFFNDAAANAGKLVGEALVKVAGQVDGVQGIFVKDFPPSHKADLKQFSKIGYKPFEFLPCMRMTVKSSWTDFDDYLGSLSSKYRVRARRAFKKLGQVEKRVLTLSDLQTYQDELYDLYAHIADAAEFNLASVPRDYFYKLKSEMPGDFQVIAYFENGKPIAFYTYFLAEFGLEAHYIGFEARQQQERQLYLNILYDLIRDGIEHDVNEIHFARTATEIKSSVGALPETQTCLIRHKNPIWNAVLGPVVGILQGAEETYQTRHPFKD